MIEKSIMVIIFMYAASFGLLGAELIFANSFGITLVNFEGVEIHNNLLDIIDEGNLNTITGELNTINGTAIEENPITEAAKYVVIVFQLLTGTYVFDLLALLGVPQLIISGMVVIYSIMLFRTLIAYLRGV